nr:acyltransferase family protein [Trichococcus ilyis]
MRRLVQIVPFYFFMLLVSAWIPVRQSVSIVDWVLHFTFINAFVLNSINSIINEEWYIVDLVIFIVIAPFFVKLADNLKRSIWLFVFSAVISIAFTTIVNYNATAILPIYGDYLSTFCFVNQFPVICLGGAIFYLVQMLNSKSTKEQKCFLLKYLSIVLTGIFVCFRLNKRFVSSSLLAGIIFSFVVLFLAMIDQRRQVLFDYVLGKIGRDTLGIYLTHMILIRCLLLFAEEKITSIGFWSLGFVVVFVLSYVIGKGLNQFVQLLMKK